MSSSGDGSGAGAGAGAGSGAGWVVPVSASARNSFNPIRQALKNLVMPPAGTEVLKLSLGDPSVFGNLKPCSVLVDAVKASFSDAKHDGYVHSCGTVEARTSVATRYTSEASPLTAEDVVLACGGSQALLLAIQTLCHVGDNILVPKPLFPLYATIASSVHASSRYYRLNPDRDWECDLEEMESLIDEGTRAIVINNPSNPCGSVYTKQHLLDILALAEKHKLVVISDEIYRNMCFSGHDFHSMGELSVNVPVLVIGGMAKEFLVPGWRVGWILIHDRHNAFANVRKGLFNVTTLTMGTPTPLQAALPAVVTPSEENKEAVDNHLKGVMSTLEANAEVVKTQIAAIPGLQVNTPAGAMYSMVRIQLDRFADIEDDYDFAQKLLLEKAVFVLPGVCFKMPGFFRVVFCAPKPIIEESFVRIAAFCASHAKSS